MCAHTFWWGAWPKKGRKGHTFVGKVVRPRSDTWFSRKSILSQPKIGILFPPPAKTWTRSFKTTRYCFRVPSPARTLGRCSLGNFSEPFLWLWLVVCDLATVTTIIITIQIVSECNSKFSDTSGYVKTSFEVLSERFWQRCKMTKFQNFFRVFRAFRVPSATANSGRVV